jgi:hypothetical protein
MADYKQGATWPPHRMKLADEDGTLLPLAEADAVAMIAQFGEEKIEGPLEVIDPPDEDGFNARYNWEAGDTDVPGDYEVEAVITWDAAASPPAVDRVPNGDNPTFTIIKKLG